MKAGKVTYFFRENESFVVDHSSVTADDFDQFHEKLCDTATHYVSHFASRTFCTSKFTSLILSS